MKKTTTAKKSPAKKVGVKKYKKGGTSTKKYQDGDVHRDPRPRNKSKYSTEGLTNKELDALSHQRRGMGDMGSTYVKKSGPIMNELGSLTPFQQKQLKAYMNKASTSKKVYEALPNAGRIVGKSAADVPEGSRLSKQKKGGTFKKPKAKKK
jgi:hypothetical protein